MFDRRKTLNTSRCKTSRSIIKSETMGRGGSILQVRTLLDSAMISYSTLQHPLVGDLLLVADENRLLRSSYLDSKLAPKLAQEWICDSTHSNHTFAPRELGLAAPDHTVPYGRFFRGAFSQALRGRLRSLVPAGH